MPSRVMRVFDVGGHEEVRGDVVGPVAAGDHLVDVGAGDLVDQVAVDVAELTPGVVGDEERGVFGGAAQSGRSPRCCRPPWRSRWSALWRRTGRAGCPSRVRWGTGRGSWSARPPRRPSRVRRGWRRRRRSRCRPWCRRRWPGSGPASCCHRSGPGTSRRLCCPPRRG